MIIYCQASDEKLFPYMKNTLDPSEFLIAHRKKQTPAEAGVCAGETEKLPENQAPQGLIASFSWL
jgi:hypothetical protein